jgi:hypothetical protein
LQRRDSGHSRKVLPNKFIAPDPTVLQLDQLSERGAVHNSAKKPPILLREEVHPAVLLRVNGIDIAPQMQIRIIHMIHEGNL